MKHMLSEPHRRRSIRLKNYDYSLPGAYFVTISAYQKIDLFGEISGLLMTLNQYGNILHTVWTNIPSHYPNVHLDSFVIMPNHLHGIIIIERRADLSAGNRADLKSAPTKKYPLSEIVRSFKSFSTREINKVRNTPGSPVWQRNYHERIVRDEIELNTIREYIKMNAIRWPLDNEYFKP